MTRLRSPTTAPIPGHIKVPSTKPALVKSLSRLSRGSIIDLALRWLESDDNPALYPYLETNRNLEEEAEEDYLYTPANNLEELRQTYNDLRTEKGSKRDIIDRILDGDWRRGISLQQLAMIDFQHLQDNDTALRWTAWKLVPLDSQDEAQDDTSKPRKHRKLSREPPSHPLFEPESFMSALSSEVSSLVKAHYHLEKISHTAGSSTSILRLHVSDSPYATSNNKDSSAFLETARTLYVALPNSCPYIYVSLAGSATSAQSKSRTASAAKVDIANLKRTVLEAVPKALSRPQERWSIQSTDLTAKSLQSMCALRGNDRGGASGGAFSIFAEGVVDDSPLDPRADGDEQKQTEVRMTVKRKRKALEEKDSNVDAVKVVDRIVKRFGGFDVEKDNFEEHDEKTMQATMHTNFTSAPALDRVSVRIEDGVDVENNEPQIQFDFTFGGSDIFAGLRQLAELGSIDVESMPSWMTGEEGASTITVRDGIVVDGKAGGAC